MNDIFSHESKIWMESTSGDDQDPDHRFGPEATTADIILQKQEPKLVIPPYHLLGKIKLRAFEVLFIIPLLSFLFMTFNNLMTCISRNIGSIIILNHQVDYSKYL